MIKANEFRLGNIVAIGTAGQIVAVDEITPHTISVLYGETIIATPNQNGHADYLEPIPLSEEWLLKMGFENKAKPLGTSNVVLGLDDNGEDEWCIFLTQEVKEDDSRDIILLQYDIEHVHQLQNLYFALTGEELQIQLP